MQVKVCFVLKSSETFLNDKHINAIKKLRNFYQIKTVENVSLSTDFNEFFSEKSGSYLLLANDTDYATITAKISSITTKNNLTFKIIKLGYEFNLFSENLPLNDNEVVYKAFNVSPKIIENFLVDYNVKYTIVDNAGDIKIVLNFSNVSVEEKDQIIKAFLTEFSTKIYALSDVLPQNLLVQLLKLRGEKIAVAESFTGGNLSAAITSVSGSSKVFYEGLVAYDENSKAKRLGVSELTLAKYKPVSKQVAYEMCKGLLKNQAVDFCISTTGIAGPNSDDSNFPVGLCFIGVGTRDKISVYKFNFNGSREDITTQGVLNALCLAVLNLKNN